MFLWLEQFVAPDSRALQDKLIKNGVACIPGACFATPDKQGDDCPFLRLTYASATDAEMRAGASRLAATLAHYRGTRPASTTADQN
ncbi:2-aminoadipate transaminase [Aureococcus anophagefferens]|nr:2-aminoadipate transaminase [Aureococcus anophagefferens]